MGGYEATREIRKREASPVRETSCVTREASGSDANDASRNTLHASRFTHDAPPRRIPIIAAQKYGATGIGIEIDPRLVELSWRNANDAEVANRVRFIVGDLFEADLSQATVITAYLSPNIMKMLEPRLRALKPGTRIVSHQFPMTGWKPDKRLQIEESELLLWRVPK